VRQAFTLIELLVVITIVVVLLALLAPALDKAIYQAELAVCGTRLRAAATAIQTYASASKRFYPVRIGGVWPNQLCNVSGTTNQDDRLLLRQWMGINANFLCPLSGKVNLEDYGRDAAGRATMTYSSYAMWFNFQYALTIPEKAMRRVGDRFTFTQSGAGGESKTDSFNILLMDSDVVGTANDYSFSAHQDKISVQAPWTLQSEPYDPGFTSGKLNYAFWWWGSFTTVRRGPVDTQYVHDDGSVRRIEDVKFLPDDRAAADAGMARLPIHRGDAHAYRLLLPTR